MLLPHWSPMPLLHFCHARHLKCPSFRGPTHSIILTWSTTNMSLAQCRNCTAVIVCGRWQTSAGTHHHPGPVSSAVSGALCLDVSPIMVFQCFDSFHCGLFFRYFLVIHQDLYFSWICLPLLWTGLRRFSAGHLGLYFFLTGFHHRHQLLVMRVLNFSIWFQPCHHFLGWPTDVPVFVPSS
jgi:hypothetical protein